MFSLSLFPVGGFPWQLTEFIIGVFLQVLGLPFVAVAQVSLFSKVTAEKTQGEKWRHLWDMKKHWMLDSICYFFLFSLQHVHDALSQFKSNVTVSHFKHVHVICPAPYFLAWYCRFQSGSAPLSGRSSYHPGPSLGWRPY